LLLVSVPILAVANYWIMSHMLPLFRSMQALIDGINRVMRDQLSGVRVVRAFTREGFERDRFSRANAALSNASLTAGNWQALMLPVTTLTINVSSVALIWFGGLRIDRGQMQVGSLTAFLAYFTQILMAVLMATMTLVVLPRASVCAERITEVLSTRAAVESPQRPKFPKEGISGIVRLDGATFTYPGADRPVLQDISLTVLPGTTTAVVGSTGSGKSTLVSLICRLYDVTAGAVLLDDLDVREYDTERLWSAIGLVPQRGYLFSGTVADNLRYGKSDATDQEMWVALRVAAADEFVRAHSSDGAGLQMPVAQGGINFSGGQRQRLAIARAVIRRPAIYLFDDAFSALDVHTDARVRAALREISGGATIIVVTQRISTAAQADQVIVIDNGKIVGAGTHESLLTDCGTYAEFAASQSMSAGVGGAQ
jgi:ABC-type multidrug transport system fused ATPase/permease subunit